MPCGWRAAPFRPPRVFCERRSTAHRGTRLRHRKPALGPESVGGGGGRRSPHRRSRLGPCRRRGGVAGRGSVRSMYGSASCLEAGRGGAGGGRFGPSLHGHLCGYADALRGFGGRPGRSRAGRASRHGPADPGRGEAAPDAMESRAGQRAIGVVRRAWTSAVDVLRALLLGRRPRRRDRHLRLWRSTGGGGGAGERDGHPVPPGEIGVGWAGAARQCGQAGPPGRRSGAGVIVYPAIDVRGGQCVRLRQGDYAQETVYGADPVAVAVSFADAGAEWIHVVDLDAARSGEPTNRPVIGSIADAVRGQARIQTGGGVRTMADVEALARAGVGRVVMGTAAVAHPELVEEASIFVAVAVGLDHRGGELAVHGWTEGSRQLIDVLDDYPAADSFVVTEIGRDGMLIGPDLDGLERVMAATAIPVIASGGIATLDDLKALA